MPLLLLSAGILLLLLGGACLVRGASGVALRLKVPPLMIGLTVVAFGTSTPELVVNISGALSGQTDLAFGNAVGSNLANFGLVLGVSALIAPIYLSGQVVRREVPFLLLVTAILLVMASDRSLSGSASLLDRGDALMLFLLFSIFVFFIVRDIAARPDDPVFVEPPALPLAANDTTPRLAWHLLLIVAGIASLVAGGELTISQGWALAMAWGVPAVVIGTFVIAIGTSLPELITSAVAAYRRETDLALGNIVGSNLFNTLIVLPAAAVIAPVAVPTGGVTDLLVGFAFVLVLIPLFLYSNARLGRPAGGALVSLYGVYMAYRFLAFS